MDFISILKFTANLFISFCIFIIIVGITVLVSGMSPFASIPIGVIISSITTPVIIGTDLVTFKY